MGAGAANIQLDATRHAAERHNLIKTGICIAQLVSHNLVPESSRNYLKKWKTKKPAAPYSPAGESRSTLGEEALDFRVRNGNGYDSLSMATGKNDCRVDGLKGIAARREGDPCHNEVGLEWN